MSSSRIRCVFVLHDLAGGGAERVTLNLVRNLDRDQFDPVLFLFARSGALLGEVPSDVTLVAGREPHQGFVAGRISILKALLATVRDADIVVGALEHQAIILAAIASVLTGKPAIGWVHKDLRYYASGFPALKRGLYRLFLALVFRRLCGLVTVSRGAANSLMDLFPRLPFEVQVIYNPIDAQTVAAKALEAVPEWTGKVFAKPVVIAAGRLEPVKGFDLLIEAHARLRKRGHDHHLLILGEGSQRDFLKTLAGTHGVSESVFMPGFCNPFPLMRRSAIFVLSSRSEGLPTVVVEAMAIGLPVVATRSPGGSEELLDGGRCGLLVRPDDIDDLTRHLEMVLQDPQSLQSLAPAARNMVASFHPTIAKVAWEALLQSTVAREKTELRSR